MLHRLILKVTKFQLPPPKHLSTVVKNILGPPMSNRVKVTEHNFDENLQNLSDRPNFAEGAMFAGVHVLD